MNEGDGRDEVVRDGARDGKREVKGEDSQGMASIVHLTHELFT